MFCRRALQRIGPLARRALKPTSTNPPVRHMAFGVPGGSNNMMYFVLCGGGFTAALVYAYKTVSDDSVRYEGRVANMGSSEKAPAEAAPAEAAPAEAAPAEAALAGEPAPLEEVVTEPVTAPAEAVAETAAEPVVEVETKVAATEVLEPAPTEAPAEALVAEEPSSPVTEEAVPEAVPPGSMEVAALEDTTPEAPAAESAGLIIELMPDLLSAEKVLAGSAVEIAAASVGDHSLVEAVRQTEDDKKGFGSTVAGLQKPETLEATEEEIVIKEATEEVDAAVDKEVKPVEEVAEAKDAEDLSTKEVSTEETSAHSVEEKEAISIPEEPSAPTVEEVGDVDDVAPATSEEEASVVTAFHEEALPVVDDVTTITAEHTPRNEALEEKAATAEASSQGTVEATLVGDKTELAAASTESSMEGLTTIKPESALEIPVEEAKHCHSCHSVSAAGEEVAPPAAVGEQLKGAVEVTHEAVTLEKGQTRELTVVVMIDQ